MRRIVALLLVLTLILVSFSGCKPKEDLNYTADQSYMFGMDYIAFEGVGNGIDYVKAFELMHNLGVKSIRHWMHVTWFFDENFEPKQKNIDLMHDIIAEAQKYDIQLIGMSHRNINKYGYTCENDKISRTSDYYPEWIANFEKGWFLLALEFPEITIWEIDNETNNVDFMHNAEGGAFTLQEMADISCDMFYYGSRGIHAANPDATTVMGGFVTWSGKGFLELVYENIKSGAFGEGSTNPDDYFEALAWHPYTTLFNIEAFVRDNLELYELAYSYEGKHKTVYFTELGGWDNKLNQKQAAEYVTKLYTEVPERLPFVESMHYFRAFNNIIDNNSQWGLFVDPNPNRMDMVNGERMIPGSPKQSAYAYQAVAGGSGPLDLLIPEEF